jgi:enoyl-CoA hydratase/3-hydroxyacyl-CoA dehydrogenase
MSNPVVRLDQQDDIALITVDSPPVNALSVAVRDGLADAFQQANADDAIHAIVVTGANQNFVAGADINELKALAEGGVAVAKNRPSLTVWLDKLEASDKPVVMAVDGFALGGGLELAMAGHYRVATTRCRVGLPELTLGILPGAGGTQRLPRLAGLEKACEMMLMSRESRGKQALEDGIVDEMVEPEQLLGAAKAAARKLAAGELPRRISSQLTDRIPAADQVRQIGQAVEGMFGDKTRNQIHHQLCLDAAIYGALEGYAAGVKREGENFIKCLEGPQSAGMMHMFFASKAVAKVPGVTDQKLEPKPIRKVGVLGGGTMGSGIATWLISSGIDVVLKEANEEFAEAGRGRIDANLSSRLKRGKLSQDKYDAAMARLTATTKYDGFDQFDMVIEAVTENIELKQAIFADLEKATRPDCILASNTSTIDLDVIAKNTHAAERIVGTHFFSPAHVMPLVEVVRSKHTSPETILTAVDLVKRNRKTPVTVGNCVGFLVNRIFFHYSLATYMLADRGVDPYRIDKALFGFGMPMGPFRMHDLAGIDVGKFAGGIMADAYADRAYRSTLGLRMVDVGRLGQKTGKGYYQYEDGKTAVEDPDIQPILAAARADAGNPDPIDVTDDEIIEMALFGVVNEACRTLDEGIAIRASDIDVASVMGMGFPAYRGGIMKAAETRGIRAICDKLSSWADSYGDFLAPCEYLKRKAAEGETLG